MTDVFISYAREDRECAQELASAFGANGWSVWWDRNVIAGQAFDHAIEQALENAKCVVVLWSKASVSSEWVKNEAAVAVERGVLVPALIESVKLPLEFRRKQTADLVGWDGDPLHEGFQALCEGVSSVTGTPNRRAPGPEPRASRRSNRSWTRGAIAAIALAFVLVAYFTLRSPAPAGPAASRADADSTIPSTSGEPPKTQTGSDGAKPVVSRPNLLSNPTVVKPKPGTAPDETKAQTASVVTSPLQATRTPSPRLPDTDYKVGIQTLGVSENEFHRLQQALLSRGFIRDVQSRAWTEDQPWLAKTSTVLYYDRASSQKAKELASLMKQLTNETFVTARGSGYGIDRREYSIHLVVHYVRR